MFFLPTRNYVKSKTDPNPHHPDRIQNKRVKHKEACLTETQFVQVNMYHD